MSTERQLDCFHEQIDAASESDAGYRGTCAECGAAMEYRDGGHYSGWQRVRRHEDDCRCLECLEGHADDTYDSARDEGDHE